MDQITRIGLDTSKAVFQLHGVNGAEQTVLTRKLTRARMLTFFAALPPCLVILEACGAAHHWARVLRANRAAIKGVGNYQNCECSTA